MASNIKYAVSATPIYTMQDAEASSDVDVIAADIAKTVGGSGSSTCGFANTIGFGSGAPAYAESGASFSGTALSIGTFTTTKFVYIKHTGYLWDDASTLGAATDQGLKICTVATIADATTIAVLNPGDAIVLPFNTAGTPTFWSAGDGVSIAVEFFSVRAA